jgi:hypothetical protein
MPRKTIIIFISVFIVIAAIVFGIYFYSQSNNTANQNGNTTTGYQSFNPFGSGTTTQNPGNVGTTVQNTTTPPVTTPGQIAISDSKFHQLTNFSVAGATFFEDTRPITATTPATATTTTPPVQKIDGKVVKTPVVTPLQKFETVPALRYIERVTGHIDEMYLDTKAVSIISNSTIPAIYEGVFDSKASTVIYRYLSSDTNDIESFMATLGGTQGEFLPPNITDLSVSPDKSRFFYITQNQNGVTGTIRQFGQTKKTQVFTSSYTEWLSQWAGNQKVYLTTKASYASTGNLFSLNTTTGTLTSLLGPIEGLTTLANNDGSQILYSTSTTTGPVLSVFDVAKHVSTNLDVSGLPEKCVWSADNVTVYCAIPSNISGQEYPDSWYQGTTSFNDSFIKINISTLQQTTIADSNAGTVVDGTHLFLDDKEGELYFINKKDSTLWSLDLN